MEASKNDLRASDLEVAIGWNRFILQLLGIWSDQESSKINTRKLNFKFLLAVFFMLTFVTIPQTTSLIMIWGDLDLTIENLSTANIPITSALLKLTVIWYNSKALKLLLSFVIEDWMKPKSERERQIMLKNAEIGRIISIGWFILMKIMLSTNIAIQFVINLQWQTKNATESTRRLIYQAYYPYDSKKSPYYELTCLCQCLAALYSLVSYSAVDSFLTMLVLHLCAQFSNLCFALKNIMSNVSSKKKFQKRLCIIVKRHERLNRFAAIIEDSFNLLLLVQILLCTIQVCFLGYKVVTVLNSKEEHFSLLQFVFLILFVGCMMSQFFIYCYIGEMLNTESTRVSYAAYQCEWYKLTAKEARDLTFIICRAKIPLQITAGKFCTFSLKFFSDILKTSMAYLSVLLAVRDQHVE